jgi:hypothetical protein
MKAMSEAQRAFHALEGKTFPQVGMRGRYIHAEIDLGAPGPELRDEAEVEVVHVSASGKTAIVTFVEPLARKQFATEQFTVYRRGHGVDGSGWYLPHSRGLRGEVVFTLAMHPHRRPWIQK